MTPTVKVRRLEPRDRRAWEQLFRCYIAFYQATLTDAQIAITWDRLMAAASDFHIALVAVDEKDQPVGLAHVLFHRSTWSPTHYCYLEDLFVDPAIRGKGVGRALIEAAYREADARGATRTYWATQEFNTTARRLYDQLATTSPFVQYRR
jgi:GNAT superfamily N-acetyltransferase